MAMRVARRKENVLTKRKTCRRLTVGTDPQQGLSLTVEQLPPKQKMRVQFFQPLPMQMQYKGQYSCLPSRVCGFDSRHLLQRWQFNRWVLSVKYVDNTRSQPHILIETIQRVKKVTPLRQSNLAQRQMMMKVHLTAPTNTSIFKHFF